MKNAKLSDAMRRGWASGKRSRNHPPHSDDISAAVKRTWRSGKRKPKPPLSEERKEKISAGQRKRHAIKREEKQLLLATWMVAEIKATLAPMSAVAMLEVGAPPQEKKEVIEQDARCRNNEGGNHGLGGQGLEGEGPCRRAGVE